MSQTVPCQTKRRDSNLELFRIILMLMIIMHHYVVNSGILPLLLESRGTFRSEMLLCLAAWGKTGINCFLLITGFFMCKSEITIEKFLKLFLEVVFYLLIFNLLFFGTGYVPFTIGNLLSGFIGPDISHSFSKTFLIFFLTIPFWNILIHNMSQKQHLLLLSLLMFWYTLLPTLNGRLNVAFNYVTWFGVIYLLAAYIRLYPMKWMSNNKICGLLSVILIGIGCLTCFDGYNVYFYVADSNKLLAVSVAVSTFLFFKNLKLPYNPVINYFGQSIFGVLLIHANNIFMIQLLWNDTLNNAAMLSSPWLWFHILGSVFGIFVVCSLVDHLRIRFVEKPFFVKFHSLFAKWNTAFQRNDI